MERGLLAEPWRVAAALAVLATGSAFAGTLWALAAGRERFVLVVDDGPAVPASDFLQGWVYVLAAVVGTALVGVTAFLRWQVGLVALAGVVTALAWGATVAQHRVESTGWGDGPDARLLAVPLTATVVGVCLVVAALVVRARRLRPPGRPG